MNFLKVFILLIIVNINNLFGQEYKFNVFNQEDGLPQNYVYDIAQSKNGFLYVATGDGLAIFDGLKFQKQTNRNGLSENFCNSLFYDSKNRLWIGHFEGGISYIENGKIKKIDTKNTTTSKITSFTEDKSGNIYYANTSGNIYLINNNTIKNFNSETLDPINEIKIKGDWLYIATQSGFKYVNITNKNSGYLSLLSSNYKNIQSFDFLNNKIVITVEGEGLEIYDQKGSDLILIKSIIKEFENSRLLFKHVLYAKNNTLYVSLSGEGFKKLSFDNNFQLTKIKHINQKNGLKNTFINKFFIDYEDNLWLCSYGSGLFQMVSQRFELYNSTNLLNFENIKTITIINSTEIIVSNENELNIISYKYSNPELINKIKLPSIDLEIRASYYDDFSHLLWLGTSKGLLIYEYKNQNLYSKNSLDFLKNKSINYITTNSKFEKLISTTEGLFLVDDNLKLIKYYSTEDGLPHNNILGCFFDKSKNIWMFSPETPLYKITNDSIEILKTFDTVNSYQFNNAVQDFDGNIWFGTNGGGIYKYSKNKKTIKYTTDQGLASDYIYALNINRKGDIIAGHKNGISIKYNHSNIFKSIKKDNGLQASTVNQNAIKCDFNGNVWFGTTEGLLKYIPVFDKINKNEPLLNMTQIRINNQNFNCNDTNFTLPFNQYELILNYIGISLSSPKEVKYKYKLEGYNQVWQYTDDTKITISNLTDGEYRFLIHAINADGVQTQKPLTFNIIVSKPIWKSVWFYIFCIGIISGIWYFIYKTRTDALIKTKIRLEKMVSIKTNELVEEKERVEKINELLEEKNHDITDSISYAQRIQRAILPSLEGITKKIDLFIFYRARDIVSGDFYWYYETKKHYYIAAVDCTGHGVPGAFMSLLGGTYLDQIMIENETVHNSVNAISPAKILKTLNDKIHNSFHKTTINQHDELIRDGMDIAICRIDKLNKKVMCSNAGRPFYIVSEKVLTEIKSNNISIGGKSDAEKQFLDSEISYKAGDCLYLFSDGYCDQFGGDRNKRFTTKRLKELLPKISHLHTPFQKDRIKQEFMNWKGDAEQTDDVLFIGIKLQ